MPGNAVQTLSPGLESPLYFSARSSGAFHPEPSMNSTATTLSTGLNAVPYARNADGEPLLFTGFDDDRDPLKGDYFRSNGLLKHHRSRGPSP